MSSVYTQSQFSKMYNEQFNAVLDFVADNPGKTVEDIATGIRQPYEIVYAIVMQSSLVILPNASGELQFRPHGHGPGES